MKIPCTACLLALTVATFAYAGNAAEPVGEPTLEAPTMHSLGVHWIIKGDDNSNARIDFAYRKAGSADWRKAPSLFRVEKKANIRKSDGKSSVNVPDGAWLFAGSALLLEPATQYDLKLTLTDPDGGNIEKTLKQSTNAEPVAPKDLKELHVIPGEGGGTGTAADPIKGLKEAIAKAEPGTLVLLHKGTYAGNFIIKKNGEPGHPIIFRGAGDGEAFIDGQSMGTPWKDHALDVTGQHDIWFEDLKIANAFSGIKAAGAQRIVMRRCNISNVEVGFYCSVNEPRIAEQFFVADNIINGGVEFPLPGEKWHKRTAMGIWVVGQGHDICYNRVTNMEDGPDSGDFGVPVAAIDFHHNDVSEVCDDGSEADGSERNVRFFLNRYANSLTAVSFQPVHGGPIYVFKNAAYNFRTEATKLRGGHATGDNSGMLIVHNTFVHMGPPWTNGGKILGSNIYTRNNLFIGTEKEAIYFSTPMEHADIDFDGFGGFSGPRFMKYIKDYATPDDVKANGPIEKHLTIVDPRTLFLSGIQQPATNPAYTPEVEEKEKGKWGTLMLNVYPSEKVDLRLNPTSNAANAGELLPEYGDDPNARPYLGAYAPGSELPHYGPRPVKK